MAPPRPIPRRYRWLRAGQSAGRGRALGAGAGRQASRPRRSAAAAGRAGLATRLGGGAAGRAARAVHHTAQLVRQGAAAAVAVQRHSCRLLRRVRGQPSMHSVGPLYAGHWVGGASEGRLDGLHSGALQAATLAERKDSTASPRLSPFRCNNGYGGFAPPRSCGLKHLNTTVGPISGELLSLAGQRRAAGRLHAACGSSSAAAPCVPTRLLPCLLVQPTPWTFGTGAGSSPRATSRLSCRATWPGAPWTALMSRRLVRRQRCPGALPAAAGVLAAVPCMLRCSQQRCPLATLLQTAPAASSRRTGASARVTGCCRAASATPPAAAAAASRQHPLVPTAAANCPLQHQSILTPRLRSSMSSPGRRPPSSLRASSSRRAAAVCDKGACPA